MERSAVKETYKQILNRAKRLNLDVARSLNLILLPEQRGSDGRQLVVLTPGVVDQSKLRDQDYVDRLKCFLLLQLDSISKQEFNVILIGTNMKWGVGLCHFLFSEVVSAFHPSETTNLNKHF